MSDEDLARRLQMEEYAMIQPASGYFVDLSDHLEDQDDLEYLEDEEYLEDDDLTYEQLLELGELIGNVKQGLSSSQMAKLRSSKYRGDGSCPVCLEDLKLNAKVYSLTCKHTFHSRCLTKWLKDNVICPVCRNDIRPEIDT